MFLRAMRKFIRKLSRAKKNRQSQKPIIKRQIIQNKRRGQTTVMLNPKVQVGAVCLSKAS